MWYGKIGGGAEVMACHLAAASQFQYKERVGG